MKRRIDELLAELRAMERTAPILCWTPDGQEIPMDILEARRTGSTFIRTLDGNHDYDELYEAVLGKAVDFSDLPEVR